MMRILSRTGQFVVCVLYYSRGARTIQTCFRVLGVGTCLSSPFQHSQPLGAGFSAVVYAANALTGQVASAAEPVVAARRERRRRRLDKLEIPEDQLILTNDLLGKGGFGAVYMADFNGHNAAAKLVEIEHDFGANACSDDNDESEGDVPLLGATVGAIRGNGKRDAG